MYDIDLLDELNEGGNGYIRHYRNQQLKTFNNTSYPKWKRLSYSLPAFPTYKSFNGLTIENDDKTIDIHRMNELTSDVLYQNYFSVDREYGVDKKLVTLSEVFCNAGVMIYIPKNNKKASIHMRYTMDKENPLLLEHNIIVAEANSETEIFIEYDGGEREEVFHSGVTKIFAGENAVIKLVKLQTLGDEATHFDGNVAVIKGDGRVNVIHCDMGAKVIGSDYSLFLEANNSEASINGIYIGDGTNKLDFSYKAYHEGEHSNSNMEIRGVLKDRAKKVFRGTLDFKKGSRLSKGREKESVILLNETVKSHAIPALQCSEDDVEGEHAVSAGQVDEEQLFYIMSRGLTSSEAKKVIVEASFEPIIEGINDDTIERKVKDNVHKRLT